MGGIQLRNKPSTCIFLSIPLALSPSLSISLCVRLKHMVLLQCIHNTQESNYRVHNVPLPLTRNYHWKRCALQMRCLCSGNTSPAISNINSYNVVPSLQKIWYPLPKLLNYPLLLQYIPRNMHTVFSLLCFVVVIHWLISLYPSGLLHWHCGNLTISPVPAKQPWWLWINTSCEFIMNDCITTTKQSTTKPCAYFLGYTSFMHLWYNHMVKWLKYIYIYKNIKKKF